MVSQVPLKTYLIVGQGRLARHLSCYFRAKNLNFNMWSRKTSSRELLQGFVEDCDVVFLCLPDNQILSFWESLDVSLQRVVHFSGSFFHPEIWGFHPLMTFGFHTYELEVYESIPFVGVHDQKAFKEVFPTLTNCYLQIKREEQSLYHSLCVLAGNGTTLLWDLVTQRFHQMGICHYHLEPYLKKVFENVAHQTQGRWSGPWYRGDQETIKKNRDSLSGSSLGKLYENFFELSQKAGHFSKSEG